jgi:hypothetical protein
MATDGDQIRRNNALIYWAQGLDTPALYVNYDRANAVYLKAPWMQHTARERAILLTEVTRRETAYLDYLEGTD